MAALSQLCIVFPKIVWGGVFFGKNKIKSCILVYIRELLVIIIIL